MESGTRDFMAATKVSTFGRSLGKKDEILGRIFDARNFKILDAGVG
jgi:hypothetical protein